MMESLSFYSPRSRLMRYIVRWMTSAHSPSFAKIPRLRRCNENVNSQPENYIRVKFSKITQGSGCGGGGGGGGGRWCETGDTQEIRAQKAGTKPLEIPFDTLNILPVHTF
ncbi:Hypothetical predicted protein [Octopus vulgaris]|uniref:Uncharacterized protein n=1 Tax=Octopus vulgaris TaxID=6645 RepID=A0AA36BHW5_OCTVU|nr:Hypothetical predicted protein [Octopus vulgaris]